LSTSLSEQLALLQFLKIRREEYLWGDNWYSMLERSILQELGFKLDLVTPVRVAQTLLKITRETDETLPFTLALVTRVTYLILQSKILFLI
jgi:hypothetical protein